MYGDGVRKTVGAAMLSAAAQVPVQARVGDQVGFCRATAELWRWAVVSAAEHVFWLEHDFRFVRRVDLRDVAAVLEEHRDLAQVSLMRDAANPIEEAAGGLYELRRADFVPQTHHFGLGSGSSWDMPWLRHRSYFTTNPSLMRREFMAEHRFPDDGLPECEGRFGLGLVGAGLSFGVWGAGEPWVDHVGHRTGWGY